MPSDDDASIAPMNPFKARLCQTDGPTPLGTWLMAAAPATAEALGHCGFDFLVADMEHAPMTVADLTAHLRAIATTPAQAVVRLLWNDPVLVKQAMDAGAVNLMFPFIETPEQAAAAVRATRYPPQGTRGVAAVHRGSRYGRLPDYFARANDTVAVIAQLETPDAVEKLEAIAATPGIDALFIGPGDLSAAMGLIGKIDHPDVQALLAHAAATARAVGKPIGIVGPHPAMVAGFIDMGYRFVAIASDLSLMMGRAMEWTAILRGHRPASERSSSAY
jgi:4-hydroxy-2-oxoheptanedioate aldolase